MAEGEPVQVVDMKEGGCFELNESALRQVLLQEDIKDLPVVVLSVAGKIRQGKSFFLNLVVRYLKNMGADSSAQWLGEEAEPLNGFQVQPGPQSCTSGIVIWSEVFVLAGPNGEKIAVLLMDTQGTFDTSCTMKECSSVFALSTMVSSIQVYNLMMDIKRDDVDTLQLFAEYGRAAQAQGHGTKPFKSLHFLVRDWQWSDIHPLGAQGGEQLLHAKVEADSDIHLCFEHVSCYLLPYPWSKVASGGRTDADVKDLDDSFKELLMQYFAKMFSWDNLNPLVKSSVGEPVRVKDIMSHFKAYVGIFQNNSVPTPQSALEANAHVTLTSAYEMGLKTFEEIRKSLIESITDEKTHVHDPDLLDKTLTECREHALSRFQSRVTLGADEDMVSRYHERLRQDMETICHSIVELNNVKLLNEEAQKALKIAEAEKKEAEIKKHEVKKLIKELKKQKHEAERQRKFAERGRKRAEVGLIEAETLAEERLQEAELDLKEAVQRLSECEAARQKAEEQLKGAGHKNRIIFGAVRVLGGALLTAAACINPVAAVVTTVVKPIFDAAFPLPDQQPASAANRVDSGNSAAEPKIHEPRPQYRASSDRFGNPRKRTTCKRDLESSDSDSD